MARWDRIVTAGWLTVMFTTFGHAAEAQIGQIKTLHGDVQVVRGNTPRPAGLGDLLEAADTLSTGPDSSVGITFIDNSRFAIGPNSRITLSDFRFNPTTQEGQFLTEVQRGSLAVISGQIAKRSPEAMRVKTPTTILGVRGTTFAVQVVE
jgi:hypothetical protein